MKNTRGTNIPYPIDSQKQPQRADQHGRAVVEKSLDNEDVWEQRHGHKKHRGRDDYE